MFRFFYQCSSFQICIPYQFVCDGHNDCQQGEDENCSGITSKIKTGSQHTSNNETFKCLMTGKSIPPSFLDDFVPECPTSFEDEVQYYNLLTAPYQSSTPCTNITELPCVPGHNYCFPLNKLCIYDFHHNSLQLKYCRNGAHLHNCTHFQYLGYFKCPLSYCIPFDLVCNSNWDCPGGHDEHKCLSHSCVHLFRCKNQNKCLHFAKVCDESKDCIYGDDELLCVSGYSLSCPLQCVCFVQSIVCEYLNHFKYQKIWGFIKYFKCYKCTLKISDIPFSSLVNIKFLDIKNHFSKHICINKEANNSIFLFLRKLDMSFNKITIMQSSCLESLQSLKILYLQVNRIVCVRDKAFNKLRSLKILDLSYNKITKLTKQIFHGLHSVTVIILTANLITSINADTFNSIPHFTVHSLNKQVCCMSGSWLKCKVKNNEFSNCNDLLSKKGLSKMCWFIGTLTCLMNLTSIAIHVKLFSQLQTNKFFTLFLSVVDCLYGMYLLIISFADLHYRGHYAGAEYMWKQSYACKTSSFMTLLSFIASPMILFIIVLARFCVIKWPMTSKFKYEGFSRKLTFTVLVATVSFCFILVVSFIFGPENHVPSEVCLLLYTTGQLSKLILFSSLLVICVQIFCLISNVTLNVLPIVALVKHSITSQSLKKGKDKQIIINLLYVMFTNICCWIPSTTVFILPFAGYQVSSNLLAWIVITVVPINAIANPILFSILTPTMIRWVSNVCSSLRNH